MEQKEVEEGRGRVRGWGDG